MRDLRLLRLDADGLREVADLSRVATYHCNDMVTDARGRSYVGNFGFDFQKGEPPRTAAIALVTPDGGGRVAAPDLSFPNGTVISRDGRTLIVGESFSGRLTAFDVAEDGSLANRRVWAQLEKAVPDGICLDAGGGVRAVRSRTGSASPPRRSPACSAGPGVRRYSCAPPRAWRPRIAARSAARRSRSSRCRCPEPASRRVVISRARRRDRAAPRDRRSRGPGAALREPRASLPRRRRGA